LHRMISYESNHSNESDKGSRHEGGRARKYEDNKTCDFCQFDRDSPLEECRNMPEYIKSETGSMDCQSELKRKCSKKDVFHM